VNQRRDSPFTKTACRVGTGPGLRLGVRSERVSIYLLTGPSASGKTTAARLLAQRFDRGVHVEGDLFRRSIVSGRADITPELTPEALQQLRLRYRLAAAATDTYFDEGFTVVFEDVIAGELLPECASFVRGRPLHVVVLLPSIDVLAKRQEARERSGYGHWSVEQLYAVFADATPRLGAWLDTSNQTPEQTVDEILVRTANGQLSG
jgi:chloramphenicol 3-O-phosphotransferase